MPLAFCLKAITFVPQQTEKRYIIIFLLKKRGEKSKFCLSLLQSSD
ncbi:hypothetical protein C789_4406 [Microcystis aeruginosa FACHB-905 = DIANCHI905]|nr:hypothetical protein C789_4406 [Microcystis aeruginosa FACHB-905 = DIANCHI905]